jgi:hypothetical protein
MRIEQISVLFYLDGYTNFQHFSQFHVAPACCNWLATARMGGGITFRVSRLIDASVKQNRSFSHMVVPKVEKWLQFAFYSTSCLSDSTEAVESRFQVKRLLNIFDAPDAIRDSGLHHRRAPRRLMHRAKVVLKRIDRQHMLLILDRVAPIQLGLFVLCSGDSLCLSGHALPISK